MTKKKAKVQCKECYRWVNLEEARFDNADEAEAGEFLCRLCVLKAILYRLGVENAKLVAQIEDLESELRGEQEQRKVVEEKLKGREQEIAKIRSATVETVNEARV